MDESQKLSIWCELNGVEKRYNTKNKNTNTNLKWNQAMHFTDQNTGMILMKKGNKTQDTGIMDRV